MKPKPQQKQAPARKKYQRQVAVYRKPNISNNEHGGVMLDGYFEFEDGSTQAISQYQVNGRFLLALLQVFGVAKLSQIDGKAVWVTHDQRDIVRLDPLIRDSAPPMALDGIAADSENLMDIEEEDETQQRQEHDL